MDARHDHSDAAGEVAGLVDLLAEVDPLADTTLVADGSVAERRSRPFGSALPAVTVVVPAMNEERNLPYVLPQIPDWVDEVILVDGHSTDATVDVAFTLRPGIKVVRQEGKGKGDALQAGFRAAEGEIIVMLDADGSTLPSEIPGFVGALLAGADFAKGSRFAQGGDSDDISIFRRLGNQFFVVLGNLLFGSRYTDLCYGYNAFWKRHLPLLALTADGFEIETMMNLRAVNRGLKVVEIPSFEARRHFGESRLRAIPDGLRVLRTVLIERFSPTARHWRARRLRRRQLAGVPHAQEWAPVTGAPRPATPARNESTVVIAS